MQRTFTAFILTTILACNGRTDQNNSIKIINDSTNIAVASKPNSPDYSIPGKIHKFDSSATVNGCADVYLQKISRDLQFELLVELEFDSIPKFKEIDISKYSRFVHIYFNKYARGNKYVDPICNDAPYFPKEWKPPTKYSAVAGILTITYWSGKEFIVSVVTKNLVLQNKSNDTINIPFESFDKLRVHWIGG
jgi:hypothetical protein